MVVMADNNAEIVKFIGRREMDMDENMKTLFYVNDKYRYKPYFNDAKELFIISFWVQYPGK